MYDLTNAIRHYLTSAPASLFAGADVEIMQAWEGDDHLLWRVAAQGQIAVVKLFMDAGQARSRRQFDGHERFAPRSLAPVPLWTDRYPEGLARQLLVYTWSPGTPIDPSALDDLAAWAAAVAQLHAVAVEELRRFSPHPANLDYFWRIEATSLAQIQGWLSTQQSALAPFLIAVARAAETEVHWAQAHGDVTHPTPVHGDLRIAHTLLDRGTVLFLDWELFGIGDPALDVARLLHCERHEFPAALQQRWLQHYLQDTDSPAMEERITRYRRLLALHDVIFLLVGLEQQSRTELDQPVIDALPFLHTTLVNALDEAATAFTLTLPDTTTADVQAILNWIQRPRT